MRSLLNFILSIRLKSFKKQTSTNGFTLIELLVAMIMAVLIITPLMGFMIDILQTDRREQAKATTEQEMQTAYDYIARDLQQAIYIYDADGITRDRNTTDATLSGIKNQIPPAINAPGCSSPTPPSSATPPTCIPILVFWKREFRPNSVGVTSSSDTNTNDGFAYSLVAYYLITTSGSNWSPSARIGRFQITGNVNIGNVNSNGNTSDVGFNPPPLGSTVKGTTLKAKMNQWVASVLPATGYTQPVVTLVDYVYNFPSATNNSFPACASPNAVGDNKSGFYACVDATNTIAQVFLRGNAYVRLYNRNTIQYSPNNSDTSFFPVASGSIQGRGFLFTK